MGVSGGCFSRNSCPNAGYGVGNNYPRSVLGVGVGLALPNAIRCDFKTKQNKETAMRKIILGTVLGFVFSIGAYTSAKAGNGYCEESDPCAVWEMIYPNGDIQRIICNPSVCGSGIFDNKVVRLELTPTPWVAPPDYVDPCNQRCGTQFAVATTQANSQVQESTPAPTAAPVDTAPQPTSLPEATPAPPVVGQPTPTSVPPIVVAPTSTPVVVAVATAAPTQLPSVVVVTVVGTSSISIPSVSVTALRKTQEEQEDEDEWEPKRRRWGGEQQAI